jgi:RNA polymerase sigma-70 factor (ECF subfamily)
MRRPVPSRRAPSPQAPTFDSFYRREYVRIVAIARSLLRSGTAAEDLAQESFAAAHRHWERISRFDDPAAWVRRVAINRATSLRRQHGAEWRALSRLGGRAGEDTLPELSPQGTEIWDAVRRLPRRQAQAIVLHYVDQRTVEEIGEILDCTAGTVKTHLFRARARLSESLSAWNEESA